MPNDVKAYVSVAIAIVAIVLAYWSGSPVRPEFGRFLLGGDVALARLTDTRQCTPIGSGQSFPEPVAQ